MSQLGILLAISKGKCYKNFHALRAQRNVYFKGQIDVFDYFCAKREEKFEVLCISKGKLTAFFARSAQKIFRIFKGKLRFLVLFSREARRKFWGFSRVK